MGLIAPSLLDPENFAECPSTTERPSELSTNNVQCELRKKRTSDVDIYAYVKRIVVAVVKIDDGWKHFSGYRVMCKVFLRQTNAARNYILPGWCSTGLSAQMSGKK